VATATPRPRGLGYDPERDVFPSTVYSSVEGVPLAYEYERPGRRRHDPDEVRRRRDVQGRFGVEGDSFSGGWRPDMEAPGNVAYDITGTRAKS
jgi:hypothetical protein